MRLVAAALAAVSLFAAASASAVSIVIIHVCSGSEGRASSCAYGPTSSHPDGSLEFEPRGLRNDLNGDARVTSGWITVPSASALLLTAVGDSEIRSIGLPEDWFLAGPVFVEANGSAIGMVDVLGSLDLEALLGGASSLRLSLIDPVSSRLPLLVEMASFAPSSDPLTRASGHVLITAVPEPASAALLAAALAALAARRGRRASRRCQ